MSEKETSKSHSAAEGQRVHTLASLGGLVSIAGLEHIEPNLLLGALCEIAHRLPKLASDRILELKQIGDEKLIARNAQKRTFKTWQRAQQTERFDFSREQMTKLIKKFGGKTPALDKDIGSELRRLLKDIFNGN